MLGPGDLASACPLGCSNDAATEDAAVMATSELAEQNKTECCTKDLETLAVAAATAAPTPLPPLLELKKQAEPSEEKPPFALALIGGLDGEVSSSIDPTFCC
jgi:hypothetical protein